MPSFILENYAAGLTSGSLQAVSIFVDISGFSSMTDVLMGYGQHGAEVLAEVMRAAFAPLIQAVYEQGGFIVTHAGDSFTGIFPWGGDPDQAAWRALAAAQNIQQHVAAQPCYKTPYGEFPISVKTSLASGGTAWGILTSANQRRAMYYFEGSAIDNSAAAEHHARPGQILLDSTFYTQVQAGVGVEPVDQYYRVVSLPDQSPAPLPVALPELDLELAKRFIPKNLFTQRMPGEFRQVVYLFISLTAVCAGGQLERFAQTVFDLQDQYGGLPKLIFGDKGAHMLLIWGAPVAFENDVERALSFILELQARTAIPVNGGITYRIAHAGFIGSDLSEEYAAYGRGVNLAARFMTSAPRGEIWLDEYIARKAEERYSVEYNGEQKFKGFAQPQKVYVLFERKEASEIAYEGELVGRQAELQQLGDFVRPIFGGQYAGIIVVWGEPGMGKSRLVHEFLKNVSSEAQDRTQKLQVFLAQSDAILREPLNPFRYWLKHYFGVLDTAAEVRNKRSFDRKLDGLIAQITDQRLAGELDRTRSFLGALVGLTWPNSLYEQFDAQARYENTLIGLTTLLQAESLQGPMIFFLEDAHLLDDDSKAYLPRLVRTLKAEEQAQYPIAFLITARFEGAALPLEGFEFQRIDLAQLNRSALAAFVQSYLGKSPTDALLELLETRAEGNPLFAEQVLRYLQEENLLKYQGDAWDVAAIQHSLLPTDVNAFLVARLDRLLQAVKEVVLTAAVLGREFEVRLLSRMLRDDEALPYKIAQAERESIWAALSEIRYIFRHAMLRDAAYQMQVRTRQRALHALAVEALESLYAIDLGSRYGELAYHAEQASLIEKACLYLHKAGDAAREAYQNNQAVDYYTRALALTPESDPEGRFELLFKRENVYEILSKMEERQEDLNALHALSRQLADEGKLAVVLSRQSDHAHDQGDFTSAAELGQQCVDLALSIGKWETAIQAYNRLALAELRQNAFEAASRHVEQGLELSDQHAEFEKSWLLTTRGLIAFEQRDISLAQRTFEQCLSLAQRSGERRAQARSLNNLGMIAGYQSNYQAAQKYYEQALALARETGVRAGEGLVLGNLGWIAGNMGEYQQARSYAEQNLRIAREVGNLYDEAYALINLSSYTGALGDHGMALHYAQQGLELCRRMGETSGEAWAQTYLGHNQFALGRLDAAAGAYQAALEIRRKLGQPVLATEPLAGLARTALANGDQGLRSAACNYVEEVLDYLGRGGSLAGTDEPLRVYYSCYLVLAYSGDGRAASVLETAYQALQARTVALQDAVSQKAFIENVEINRLILAAWNAAASPQVD
ncbi:MAG: tetratricopeptide repeat protein [Chloroflexota bacterium]